MAVALAHLVALVSEARYGLLEAHGVDAQVPELEKISRTRTEQAQRVDRSRILLAKADGKGVDEIAAMYGVYVDTVNPNAHRPLDEPWRQSSG